MRTLLVVLALAVAGCSVGLRLDLRGEGGPREPKVAAGLGRLILAYRDVVEQYCTNGALLVVECTNQRTHLRSLLEATTDEDRRLRASAVALAAGGVQDLKARARLLDAVDPILLELR